MFSYFVMTNKFDTRQKLKKFNSNLKIFHQEIENMMTALTVSSASREIRLLLWKTFQPVLRSFAVYNLT